jgi:hypothetical protein
MTSPVAGDPAGITSAPLTAMSSATSSWNLLPRAFAFDVTVSFIRRMTSVLAGKSHGPADVDYDTGASTNSVDAVLGADSVAAESETCCASASDEQSNAKLRAVRRIWFSLLVRREKATRETLRAKGIHSTLPPNGALASESRNDSQGTSLTPNLPLALELGKRSSDECRQDS